MLFCSYYVPKTNLISVNSSVTRSTLKKQKSNNKSKREFSSENLCRFFLLKLSLIDMLFSIKIKWEFSLFVECRIFGILPEASKPLEKNCCPPQFLKCKPERVPSIAE